MFLARIDGTIVPAKKHETLDSRRLLIGQRLEPSGDTSGDPLVLLDLMGALVGSTVIVSTDGDLVRRTLGNSAPVRLVVVGIVDGVYMPDCVEAGSQ
jgi:ethanolamine utilization protein EutN